MKKPKETKKGRKYSGKKVLTLVGGLVIVVILLFINRGWIRESFLPNGPPSYFARKSLQKAYTQAADSVKEPIADMRLVLPSNVGADCHLFAAEGVQTSVSCYASSGSEIQATEDYINSFKQRSTAAEDKVLQRGWTKVHNAAQPINELFNKPDNDVSIGVNYEKHFGKNICKLSLHYNAYEKNPSKLYYSLNCARYLYFLGDPNRI